MPEPEKKKERKKKRKKEKRKNIEFYSSPGHIAQIVYTLDGKVLNFQGYL